MAARSCAAALLALLVSTLVFAAPKVALAADDGVAIIETETGSHTFTVEIAATPAARSQGLMFRQSLEPDHGMLFDFERDGEISMWMRNTYISLDMIFIDSAGRVHRIAKATTPFSTETIPSRGPVRSVLEIAAGGAERIGLKRGDTVRHSIFSNVP